MNPLDWRGPEFLAFYAAFAASMLIAQYAARRLREDSDTEPPQLNDPYEIAYLRGGENELLRVVMVNLLEQHRLHQVGPASLKAVSSDVLTPSGIEKAVLTFFSTTKKASAIFAKKAGLQITAALAVHKDGLTDKGLLISWKERAARIRDTLIVIGILVGTAAGKISLALDRGKSNIGFLVLMAIVVTIASLALTSGRITPLGRRTLGFLQEAFDGVRLRAGTARDVSPAEVAIMAAVFGMPLLAETSHPHVKRLFPDSSGNDSGSGCGSSSGCGSGCGGGGCGGCGGD